MGDSEEFVDYYALLQVNPSCDAKILEKAYHHFAHKYHPDHAETADVSKFQEVIDAYNILRDPQKRADYDRAYGTHRGENIFHFPDSDALGMEEKSALADADAHRKILFYLYKRRRENARDAGVIAYYIQQMLECSSENFEFHTWYLKSKGLIEMTEQGELEITIEGVEHVISTSRSAEAEKLLLSQGDAEAG